MNTLSYPNDCSVLSDSYLSLSEPYLNSPDPYLKIPKHCLNLPKSYLNLSFVLCLVSEWRLAVRQWFM